jgi:ribonuclease PH
MPRIDGRKTNELRAVKFDCGFVPYAEGSVLISMGNTRVLCNVSVETELPKWIKNSARKGGWVTAEYGMLPRSTHTRTTREGSAQSGRTHEIKRLIGRALRGAVNLGKLGQHLLIVDCDVLQADGGTRTASITGGYVALVLALRKLIAQKKVPKDVISGQVAAVSVGLIKGVPTLDLCYTEDSGAEMDANVVMTAAGELIEVQATAEDGSFPRKKFDQVLSLAEKGLKELFAMQQAALKA